MPGQGKGQRMKPCEIYKPYLLMWLPPEIYVPLFGHHAAQPSLGMLAGAEHSDWVCAKFSAVISTSVFRRKYF
jgi:ABC-type polysaccharide transport system permease subunit